MDRFAKIFGLFQFPDGNYFYLDLKTSLTELGKIEAFQFPDGNYFYLDPAGYDHN